MHIITLEQEMLYRREKYLLFYELFKAVSTLSLLILSNVYSIIK